MISTLIHLFVAIIVLKAELAVIIIIVSNCSLIVVNALSAPFMCTFSVGGQVDPQDGTHK